MFKQLKANRMLYLMIAPTFLYFFIFRVWPIINMRLAFYRYKAVGPWEWVGLKYFQTVFSSSAFGNILTNTLIISFMKYVLLFPFAVIFAILLNELRNRHISKYVQVITYLPHFLSWVVIAGIWISLMSPNGAVNDLLKLFQLNPVDFMTNKGTIRWVLFYSEAWRSVGWDSIVYIVAILAISSSLYEAAVVDGANRMQIIWNVIIPALVAPMVMMFILNLGFFLNAGFDQVFNFTNDSVNSVIDILDTYIYRLGLVNAQYSIATVVGLIKGVAGCVLVFITHITAKKLTGKGVW